jgi:hypothetical protein
MKGKSDDAEHVQNDGSQSCWQRLLLVSLIVAPGLARAAEEPAKQETVKTEEATKKAVKANE